MVMPKHSLQESWERHNATGSWDRSLRRRTPPPKPAKKEPLSLQARLFPHVTVLDGLDSAPSLWGFSTKGFCNVSESYILSTLIRKKQASSYISRTQQKVLVSTSFHFCPIALWMFSLFAENSSAALQKELQAKNFFWALFISCVLPL